MAGFIARETVLPKNHLMERLGHEFKNNDLLQQALTHASVSRNKESYERMEFLGDRILSFVIADMLFAAFPEDKEGALAKRHSTLVKQGALEEVAKKLELSAHVKFARSASQSEPSPSILADVVEALIAALYLDAGFAAADKFIRDHWQPLIHSFNLPPEDAKSSLQEWAQARALPLPVYKVLEQSGPDHKPLFVVEVSVGGHPSQTAQSHSKQSAQKLAAEQLLDFLREKHERQ
jgi:ribonuclease-3